MFFTLYSALLVFSTIAHAAAFKRKSSQSVIPGSSILSTDPTPTVFRKEHMAKIPQDKKIEFFHKSVDSIHAELSNYFDMTCIDFPEFSSRASILGRKISDLVELSESFLVHDEELAQKIKFSRSIYHKMLSSAMILQNGKDFTKHDQKLFCEIFLVNIKLLKLCTFTGHLDLSLNGNVKNILHTWNKVNVIDSEYKVSTHMSLSEKKMFEDQVFRARLTLQYLANQVPRQRHWLF